MTEINVPPVGANGNLVVRDIGGETPAGDQTILTLSAQLAAVLDDPEASDERWDTAETIAATIPTTPAEAVVVVSILTNPDIGLEAGQTETHLTAARSLEAGLRAMAANETVTNNAAAFTEATSLFAEAGLARMPAEPTESMVAAAERTGIDPEQFRVGYRAAVAAYLTEAA
jgi:hypothetical protein